MWQYNIMSEIMKKYCIVDVNVVKIILIQKPNNYENGVFDQNNPILT